MNYVCAECSKPFSMPPSWYRACCSRPCAAAYKKHKREKKCATCGTVFLPIRGRNEQRNCSWSCDRAEKAAARRGYPVPEAVAGASWLELGDGAFTLVDEADVAMLSCHVWSKHKKGYATTKIDGRSRTLHQVLLPDVRIVDHRNRDRLDNRRANLREADHSKNSANRDRLSNNTSGYKGVTRLGGKWSARAGVRSKRIWLGRFDTREQAAAAYDRAMEAGHGDFAVLNGVG